VTERWQPPSSSEGASANTYVVKQGDTLYGIALERYGDARGVALIEAANPGLSARSLPVGHRLVLPEEKVPAPGTAERAAPAPADGGRAETKVYVVRKGDTLVSLARKFYGDASRYRQIHELNADTLSSPTATLHVGQRLRLPE
jgi:nucleoid-associated protein YgaU